MPRDHYVHLNTAASGLELRGWGYPKVANAAALPTLTAADVGTFYTTQDSNRNYYWDGADWIPLPRFGTESTAGTLDFDDATNSRPGVGATLLRETAANAPPSTGFWHTFNLEHASQDGTGNITQLAIPYGLSTSIANAGVWMRGRFGGVWNAWQRIDTPAPFIGTITGNGASTLFNLAHNLNESQPQSITIVEDATSAYAPPLGPAITIVDANTISVEFQTAPANGATYTVKVVA